MIDIVTQKVPLLYLNAIKVVLLKFIFYLTYHQIEYIIIIISWYSKKDYKRYNLYNLFIRLIVHSNWIIDKVLNWLYINQGLKEQ